MIHTAPLRVTLIWFILLLWGGYVKKFVPFRIEVSNSYLFCIYFISLINKYSVIFPTTQSVLGFLLHLHKRLCYCWASRTFHLHAYNSCCPQSILTSWTIKHGYFRSIWQIRWFTFRVLELVISSSSVLYSLIFENGAVICFQVDYLLFISRWRPWSRYFLFKFFFSWQVLSRRQYTTLSSPAFLNGKNVGSTLNWVLWICIPWHFCDQQPHLNQDISYMQGIAQGSSFQPLTTSLGSQTYRRHPNRINAWANAFGHVPSGKVIENQG